MTFSKVVDGNPFIAKCYSYEDEKANGFKDLHGERYDLIIDLHKNLRSRQIIRVLKVTSLSFNKFNIRKWLSVKLKWPPLPDMHIVDRYFQAIRTLNVQNDGKGLDFFIGENYSGELPDKYVAIALGAAHKTKMIPESLILRIIDRTNLPVVLIGGPEELILGERIAYKSGKDVISTAGKCSIHQSADIINRSVCIITPDTGMMHIAAALKKETISVWGNTVPEFGMYPYFGDEVVPHFVSEVKLPCRPCSKIGYSKCPKGHFKCMKDQNVDEIIGALNSALL
jgi:heptosyltransferase-2